MREAARSARQIAKDAPFLIDGGLFKYGSTYLAVR